jgi:hypothetical protein
VTGGEFRKIMDTGGFKSPQVAQAAKLTAPYIRRLRSPMFRKVVLGKETESKLRQALLDLAGMSEEPTPQA